MFSAAIAVIIIYYLVRIFGRKFIYNFLSPEKIKKFENMKVLKNEKRLELILLILFISPVVPKDVLIYLAGILPIKPINFLLISILGRFPSVFSSTFAGENLVKGNVKNIVLIYIITYSVIFGILIIASIFTKLRKDNNRLEQINEKGITVIVSTHDKRLDIIFLMI